MRHRIAELLCAAILITSVTVFAPAFPASATDACAGVGTVTTSAPLTYPGIGPLTLTLFFFTFSLGACATKLTLTATGLVHGWCGFSVGEGTTTNGHYFQWQGVGDILMLTGGLPVGLLPLGLSGVVNIEPNPIAGESCTSGADGFLVTGAVALTP